MSNTNKATLNVTVDPTADSDFDKVNLDYDPNGTNIKLTTLLSAALHATACEAAKETGIPAQIVITVLSREIATEAIGYLEDGDEEDGPDMRIRDLTEDEV